MKADVVIALSLPLDTPWVGRARKVLADEWGTERSSNGDRITWATVKALRGSSGKCSLMGGAPQ